MSVERLVFYGCQVVRGRRESDGRRKGTRRMASGRVNGIHGGTGRRVVASVERTVVASHVVIVASSAAKPPRLLRRSVREKTRANRGEAMAIYR